MAHALCMYAHYIVFYFMFSTVSVTALVATYSELSFHNLMARAQGYRRACPDRQKQHVRIGIENLGTCKPRQKCIMWLK